jgi:hypothetical protein
MYRSPLLLFSITQKRMTMSFRRLCKVFSLCLSAGIASIFIAAASAQTTIPVTELAGAGDELAFGLIPRQGTVVAQPIAVSDSVQRSLFSHPALQAGRARTCQALYRLGLNRAEAQTRLAQARSRKASLAGQVAYAEIRAPQEGTVSALYLKTVGAVVQACTVLAEIVPEEQGLTIRANLRPENVADVHLGQEARISLSAYDVSRYGSLEGVVQNVASNTTEREGQPPFYETIITVPDPTFTKTGQSAEIIPGMTVVVDIIGGKRSVLDYILTPINRATSVAFREN